MIEWIHPALIFFAAAALLPFVKEKWKPMVLIGFPALAFFSLMFFPDGNYGVFTIGGFEVVFGRVDKLSRVFAYVFTLMGSVGMVYALHVKQQGQHIAALIYGGGALGSVFAGDLLSLFVFWEIMAFSSVFWFGTAGKNRGHPACATSWSIPSAGFASWGESLFLPARPEVLLLTPFPPQVWGDGLSCSAF